MTQITEPFTKDFELNAGSAFEMLQHILSKRPFNYSLNDELRQGGEWNFSRKTTYSQLKIVIAVQKGKMPSLTMYLPEENILFELKIHAFQMVFEIPAPAERGVIDEYELFAKSLIDRIIDEAWVFAETL